jgi:hypothetical protein
MRLLKGVFNIFTPPSTTANVPKRFITKIELCNIAYFLGTRFPFSSSFNNIVRGAGKLFLFLRFLLQRRIRGLPPPRRPPFQQARGPSTRCSTDPYSMVSSRDVVNEVRFAFGSFAKRLALSDAKKCEVRFEVSRCKKL